ncbi:phage tail assembly chaperone [Labrys neptuniae]
MNEFEVAGVKYRCSKMPALTQFNVLRRAGPALASAREFLEVRRNGGDIAAALTPAMKAVGALSDEDTAYIFGECLSTCQRAHGKTWAPVWSKPAGRALFDDIDLPVMLQLVASVFSENYGSFFPLLDQVSAEADTA